MWAEVARRGCSWSERWRREGAGWVDQYVLLCEAMEELWVFVRGGLSGRMDASGEGAGRITVDDGVRRVTVRFC